MKLHLVTEAEQVRDNEAHERRKAEELAKLTEAAERLKVALSGLPSGTCAYIPVMSRDIWTFWITGTENHQLAWSAGTDDDLFSDVIVDMDLGDFGPEDAREARENIDEWLSSSERATLQFDLDTLNQALASMKGPDEMNERRIVTRAACQLSTRYGLSNIELREKIKPLFMLMYDHGITALSIDRDDAKAIISINGQSF